MLTLIAKWNLKQDPAVDAPTHVYWEDGRPATQQDYRTHQFDTHELVVTSEGVEMRMYSELVADVRYDSYAQMWFVVPPGEEPVSLDLSDFRATDEEITAALYQLPVIYRCVIHR